MKFIKVNATKSITKDISKRHPIRWLTAFGVGAMVALSASALAQGVFPNKPIKIVSGFAPGVGVEVTTRVLAELLTKELGQPVVVENKAGAATMIAANLVKAAPKDGYTILLLNVPQYNNYLMYRNVSYKPADFIPFAAGGISTLVMATSKTLPVKTGREFIAYAKANPGVLNYGYWSAGGTPHLLAVRMESVSGLKMQGVGYKDAGQATADLVSGRIHLFFTSVTHAQSMSQAGHANIVAIGAPNRIQKLPDVPTFIESGVEGMPSAWWGYGVPAGTPPDVVAKLEKAFRTAMAAPRYQQLLIDNASLPLAIDSPAKFSEFIERESEQWATAIRSLNLQLD